MRRSTAWLLLLTTGVPTPALWRGDKRPATRRVAKPAPHTRAASTGSTRAGWLSADPEVEPWVRAGLRPDPPVTPPRPPSRRAAPRTVPSDLPKRQLAAYRARSAPPVPSQPKPTPAPAKPVQKPKTPPRLTAAQRREAELASWPTGWDQLADRWGRG